MKRRRRLIYIALTLLLGLLLAEGLLRLACVVSPQADRILNPWKPLPAKLKPDPDLGYRGNPAMPDVDKRGFRNPAGMEHADIVVMGDSMTWGINAGLEETWPAVLRREVKRPVYGMAVGGYSPVRGLLLVPEALELNPCLVIYAVYTGNDILECEVSTYRTPALASMRLQEPEALVALETARDRSPALGYYSRYRKRQKDATREHRGIVKEMDREDAEANRAELSPVRRFLSVHCRLYGMARAVKQHIAGTGPVDALVIPRDIDEVRLVAEKHPEDYMLFEKQGVFTSFTPKVRLVAMDLDDPVVREGERLARDALVKIREELAEKRIPFLVVLIPTKEFAYRTQVAAAGVTMSAGYERLIAVEERLMERLTTFLAREEIPFHDVTPALRAALVRGIAAYPPSWDGHPAPPGYAAIARSVASAIRERGLLGNSAVNDDRR